MQDRDAVDFKSSRCLGSPQSIFALDQVIIGHSSDSWASKVELSARANAKLVNLKTEQVYM